MSHEEMADFRVACNFTMGTYQCILGKIYELRQKVCFKIQDLVLPRGLQSLESKHKFLITKNGENVQLKLGSDKLQMIFF